MNLADINLIFKRIKKGEFGQLYTELDGVKILSWFEKYANERASTAVENSLSFASSYTDNFERTFDPQKNKIKNQQAIGLHLQNMANTIVKP